MQLSHPELSQADWCYDQISLIIRSLFYNYQKILASSNVLDSGCSSDASRQPPILMHHIYIYINRFVKDTPRFCYWTIRGKSFILWLYGFSIIWWSQIDNKYYISSYVYFYACHSLDIKSSKDQSVKYGRKRNDLISDKSSLIRTKMAPMSAEFPTTNLRTFTSWIYSWEKKHFRILPFIPSTTVL